MGLAWRRGLAGLVVAVGLLGLTGCGSSGGGVGGSGGAGGGGTAGDTSAQSAALPKPVVCGSCHRLPLQESWDIQLSDTPEAPYPDVGLIELDGFDTPAATVAALHRCRAGRVVVCYIDAGTWESWRPDAKQYPKSLLGKPYASWPGERWVNITQYRGPLGTILQARVQMCRSKGFDAVDFDNVDEYTGDSGFKLTGADQLAYDTFLANLAHRAGMLVALKNDPDQIPPLLPYFDFAVDEQCYQDGGGGCGLDRFTRVGKPAFDIEYQGPASGFCPAANRAGVNTILKQMSLDAWRVACR
jgi:hypothetical protein